MPALVFFCQLIFTMSLKDYSLGKILKMYGLVQVSNSNLMDTFEQYSNQGV